MTGYTTTVDAKQELDRSKVLVGANRSLRLDSAVAILLAAAAGRRTNVVLFRRSSRSAGDGVVAIVVEFLGAVGVLRADAALPLGRTTANGHAAIVPLSWTNVSPAVAGRPCSARAAKIVSGNETLLQPTTGERSLVELRPRHELASFVDGEACHDLVDEIPGDVGMDAGVLDWDGSAEGLWKDCSDQDQSVLRQHGDKRERSF